MAAEIGSTEIGSDMGICTAEDVCSQALNV